MPVIQVKVALSGGSGLAELGSGGLVLVELQGALEVEGDSDGGFVGVLCLDNPVRRLAVVFLLDVLRLVGL